MPIQGYNECERDEDNECSENARCIDQVEKEGTIPNPIHYLKEFLYKCECNKGFSDGAPKGAIPGSVCVLDYCSDVTFCSGNSSCVNTEQQAECRCKPGFMDIRRSESRMVSQISVEMRGGELLLEYN